MSAPFTDEAIQHVADELAGFLDDPLVRQQFLHYLAQDHHVRVRTEPSLHTPADYPTHFDWLALRRPTKPRASRRTIRTTWSSSSPPFWAQRLAGTTSTSGPRYGCFFSPSVLTRGTGALLSRSALSGSLGNMGKSLVAQAANEVLRELLKQTKRWPYVANKVRPRPHMCGFCLRGVSRRPLTHRSVQLPMVTVQVPSSSPNSFVVENAQLFKGLFQLSLARGNNRLATSLFDAHLRPFLDAFLRNEEGTDASGRIHAGDQERSHALAAEIMSGAMRCLKYGGTPLSADCCAPPHAHDPALLLLLLLRVM